MFALRLTPLQSSSLMRFMVKKEAVSSCVSSRFTISSEICMGNTHWLIFCTRISCLFYAALYSVVDSADSKGYCHAEIDGHLCLVPFKYLAPVSLESVEREALAEKRRRHLDQISGRLSVSPVRESLNRTYPPVSTPHLNTGLSSSLNTRPNPLPAASQPRPLPLTSPTRPPPMPTQCNSYQNAQLQRKPAAPSKVRAEYIANQKLYVEWAYIQNLDDKNRSNGTKVTGFKVILMKLFGSINSIARTIACFQDGP